MHRFQYMIFLSLSVLLSWAQQTPQRPSPSSKTAPRSAAVLAPGSITDGVYRNPSLGFSYKIPFGWVDRTQDMQGDGEDKGQALLAVFERPPEAAGETVNSAALIAAEKAAAYPGLKNPADYFGPLTEVATAQGFKVVNEPYEFSIGSRPLVRGDFRKELGTLSMHQASLVMLAKGYVVSFTVLGGSEEEVEDLIKGLDFAATGHAQKPPRAR